MSFLEYTNEFLKYCSYGADKKILYVITACSHRMRFCIVFTSLQCMKKHEVRNIVFSSSATVYGDPQYLPLDEKHPVGGCTNPYGKTKYFIEEILRDVVIAEKVIL